MKNGFSTRRLWTGSLLPVVFFVVLQTATPTPGVGPDELTDYGLPIIRVGWFLAGFLATVLLSRLFAKPTLSRILHRRNRNNPTLREAMFLYFRVFTLVIAVFVGAGVAGYGGFLSNSALIISAVTLAVGVAAQEVIGSFVSGTALVFDPEFNVGDYIEWEDGEGTVQSITLRVTRVKTPNGELVTIPNTVLTSHPITRPFGQGNYRVVEQIGLAYEDEVDEAMAHLETAAVTLDDILAEPAPSVYIDEFGDDAVLVRVHYWIEDPHREDIFAVRSAYAEEVKTRLDAAGISISPPSEHDLQGRIEIDGTV